MLGSAPRCSGSGEVSGHDQSGGTACCLGAGRAVRIVQNMRRKLPVHVQQTNSSTAADNGTLRELASLGTLQADTSFSGTATNEQFTARKERDKTKSSSLQGLMRQLPSFPTSYDASYINIQNKHLPWRLCPTLAISRG